MKVYLFQQDGRSKFYGSISALCLDLGLSVHTLYKHDFKNKYDGKDFQIEMGTVLTIGDVKKTKLPEVKQVKKSPLLDDLPLPEPTKQTNLKVNIQDGTYIKKPDGYYFKLNGLTFHENEFFTKYGEKYSYPEKIIGDIPDLLYSLTAI